MAAPKPIKPTIKKILSLGQADFFTGSSPSYRLQTGGLFVNSVGLNVFGVPQRGSKDLGLLEACPPITDFSGAVVDGILGGVSYTSASTGLADLFMVGAGGNFYDMSLSNLTTPTALRTGGSVLTASTSGINIFKALGAASFMYYFAQSTIGRWDLTSSHPSGWIDEWSSSINTSAFHPTWLFKGAIYFGNGNAIGSIYDLNGVVSTSYSTIPGGLPLPADMIVTCLNDDSNYLVIGATKGSAGTSFFEQSDTRVFFWDTISPKFNYEWQIPEYNISGIQKFRDGFIAWGNESMWYFSVSLKPTRINGGSIPCPSAAAQSSDIFQDGVIWAAVGDNAYFATYGKMVPQAPDAYFQTFTASTNDSNSSRYINTQARFGRIYVGYNAGSSFGFYDLTGGNTTTMVSSSFAPDTVYIDLQDEMSVTKADVWLAEPLAAGDPSDFLTLYYKTDEASGVQTFGTVSYNQTPGAKRVEVYPTTSFITDQIKFIFSFDAGNVKIKKIDLYGEPILRYPN